MPGRSLPPSKTFKVAVCDVAADLQTGSAEWGSLCDAVAREEPDLLLLSELPFGPWISFGASFDKVHWERSLEVHTEGLDQLGRLGAKAVAGTRPRCLESRCVNEAFLYTRDSGLRGVHTKQYFPNEDGYYEARWFQAGPRHFEPAEVEGLNVGFLICTELMFNEHARRYGRNRVDVVLVPRAVGAASLGRWLVAARMAAIVSGAYVLSSNRVGTAANGQIFGGAGWIIAPSGDVVAETEAARPVAVHHIQTAVVRRAQSEYPCYVED
jgi:N-carbamoylputrescine amidase